MNSFFIAQLTEGDTSAIMTIDHESASSDTFILWYLAGLLVLLVGFVFLKAINQKEMKMNWGLFLMIYGVLCILGAGVYIWI